MQVSILVATRERPDELRRLMTSLGKSRFRKLDPPDVDVVVVDNSTPPQGLSAEELSQLCGRPVRVVAEPRTGIPFARNTAIRNRHPDAAYVAFVDDDMTVTPSWLEQLLVAAAEHGADFVSGPYLPRVPETASLRARSVLLRVRSPRPPDGTVLTSAATGNLLVATSWLESQDVWLDEGYARAGGSDIEWTQRSVAQGARIVHADHAMAWHWMSDDRASFRWIVARSYRVGFGQAERERAQGTKRTTLVRSALDELGKIGRAWLVALVQREPERRLAAEVYAPRLAGRLACAVGLGRPQVYRTVTSERPSPGATDDSV